MSQNIYPISIFMILMGSLPIYLTIETSFQFHFMMARIIWVKRKTSILNQILLGLSKLKLMNKQDGAIQGRGLIGYVAGLVQQKPNFLWQRQDILATMT